MLKKDSFFWPTEQRTTWSTTTQLRKLLSSAYPHICIRFVFRPTCRLSDFFPFKDRIPFAIRSHVVYKYKCQSYIYGVNALVHCITVAQASSMCGLVAVK